MPANTEATREHTVERRDREAMLHSVGNIPTGENKMRNK